MSTQNTHINSRESALMIIAALVHKLGGSVTLTQLDFDEIAYKLLYENSCPSEKTFQLFLEKRSDEQAH